MSGYSQATDWPIGTQMRNTTFRLSQYNNTTPGISSAEMSVWMAISDSFTIAVDASGAYLSRFLTDGASKELAERGHGGGLGHEACGVLFEKSLKRPRIGRTLWEASQVHAEMAVEPNIIRVGSVGHSQQRLAAGYLMAENITYCRNGSCFWNSILVAVGGAQQPLAVWQPLGELSSPGGLASAGRAQHHRHSDSRWASLAALAVWQPLGELSITDILVTVGGTQQP
ncbi:hypothetical protein FIBSPDRAFT_903241 [Athelia psychrophila]|uniref:Uncharacterized protein n=1 Tax=Athelia psychrophila TaxID=1759441 RepID=A0A167W9I1_9AGAM|nr:hypothetical protein FIBSPDRAFT_903241 [Fibularhizoctonia sp. CBS 109695]